MTAPCPNCERLREADLHELREFVHGFTYGDAGSGVAEDAERFVKILDAALSQPPAQPEPRGQQCEPGRHAFVRDLPGMPCIQCGLRLTEPRAESWTREALDRAFKEVALTAIRVMRPSGSTPETQEAYRKAIADGWESIALESGNGEPKATVNLTIRCQDCGMEILRTTRDRDRCLRCQGRINDREREVREHLKDAEKRTQAKDKP